MFLPYLGGRGDQFKELCYRIPFSKGKASHCLQKLTDDF